MNNTVLLDQLRRYAVALRDEPFRLASGHTSRFYIDVKAAVCRLAILDAVSVAILERAVLGGASFTHVGGLTMGADTVAVSVALAGESQWFSVRKEPKRRGHERLVERARLDASSQVLLVDDVVSTGGSLLTALDAVLATGAHVAGAVRVVDRGGQAATALAERGIPYLPLFSGEELGVPPLGAE